jgi:hypothetical protein
MPMRCTSELAFPDQWQNRFPFSAFRYIEMKQYQWVLHVSCRMQWETHIGLSVVLSRCIVILRQIKKNSFTGNFILPALSGHQFPWANPPPPKHVSNSSVGVEIFRGKPEPAPPPPPWGVAVEVYTEKRVFVRIWVISIAGVYLRPWLQYIGLL